MIVNWKNPWHDAIPVTMDDLLECIDLRGNSVKEDYLRRFQRAGDKLDAYILDADNIGVRWSNEPSHYFSPNSDPKKTLEILRKYKHEKT